MKSAADITDKKQLIQYPTPSTCTGRQFNSSYEQRMRVRRSCIGGPYILSKTPIVVQGGIDYAIGDYIELVGGTPTTQPVLLRVKTVGGLSGSVIETVDIVNAMPYISPPPNQNRVTSRAVSGTGVDAIFKVVFNNVQCVTCASD